MLTLTSRLVMARAFKGGLQMLEFGEHVGNAIDHVAHGELDLALQEFTTDAANGLALYGAASSLGRSATTKFVRVPQVLPPAPPEVPPSIEPVAAPITGNTPYTATGTAVHTEQATLRRESGMFDLVNQRISDLEGNPIEVPKRVDLKTGAPVTAKGVQTARPDAVNYGRLLIVDDKPLGRNVLVKDRQEMIRFIRAFEAREGRLPRTIGIQVYDPVTGQPIRTDLYTPADFLPKVAGQ
jgi:hypothetical protein